MDKRKPIGVALAIIFFLSGRIAFADKNVLDRFVGQWDLHAKIRHPAPSTASYSETYEWVLDRQFLRGQTGRKADGTQDVIYGTYDEKAEGYPFWIFSSSGSYTYLPPATWDEDRLTMLWESPGNWDISYRSHCRFPDADNRDCSLLMKDWKGSVLLDMEWRAVRRNP